MFKPTLSRRHRPRSRKLGIVDENIDRQIVAIHKAIALKLLNNPTLIENCKAKLAEDRRQGKIGYGVYIHWLSILENANDKDYFVESMTEYSDKMRRMRRQTPFVGILTEDERREALNENSLGELSSPLVQI